MHKLLLMSKRESSQRALAKQTLSSWHEFRMTMIDHREKSGVTQREVAERLGITQSAVSQFESFGGNPRLMTIVAYAQALGISIKFSAVDE